MDYGFQEIGAVVATFATSDELTVGTPVTISANGTVQKAANAADPAGIVVSVGNGKVGVQVAGFAEVACTDSTLTVGFGAIQATTAGTIAKAATGKTRLIAAVDATAGKAAILL